MQANKQVSKPLTDVPRRILVIDDNRAIHDDFSKLLFSATKTDSAKQEKLDALEVQLFGEPELADDPLFGLKMDSAYQGNDGVQMVRDAMKENEPYLLAFIDMRMPPGIDGLETIRQLWAVDPRVNVVICSAYSDYSWHELLSKLEYTDQLLILKKPFDYVEVLQLVKAMTNKWYLARSAFMKEKELRSLVQQRTHELEKISNHKTQFLSSMSHELRTPLNGIMGFTELLQDQYYGPMNEKQLRFTQQVKSCALHLLSMVDDILDFVKGEADELEFNATAIPLSDFLRSVLDMLESQFIAKKLEFDISVDPALTFIYADKRKTLQIVLNFMSNAIKYTAVGGAIQVRAAIVDDDFARVEIIDTGVGIRPEHKERLFEEFFQSERTRDVNLGGTGIGLALTRKLVELQGGSVGVESVYGLGSTFWFTVPRPRDEIEVMVPEERSDPPNAYIDLTSARILVAEDNHVNTILIKEMLKSFGVVVEIAKNGQEALDIVGIFKPDIILMDMFMPVMDGIQATRLLKNSEEFSEIPVIALTANTDENSIKACLESGAAAHVGKPVEWGLLRATITEHLREGWNQP